MDKFNLEKQYELYLQRVNLKESDMGEVQKREMRATFIGACGQMLILLRDDLGVLPEDLAIETMQDMINQVAEYFMKATNKLN